MTPNPPASGPKPRRILVRGVNWLGDAVMTTPALLRLRERFPQAHITLLTREKLAGLWQKHPALDAVIAFGEGEGPFSVAQRLRGAQSAERTSAEPAALRGERPDLATVAGGALNMTWEAAALVTSDRFDMALVLPNSPRAALEGWLARIPQRVGYARRWRRWLLTQVVTARPEAVAMRKRSVAEIERLVATPVDDHGDILPAAATTETGTPPKPLSGAHQFHEYLHLVAAVGASPAPLAPRLVVGDDEVEAAVRKFGLTEEGGQPVPLLGLNPGAEYGPAKRWPAECFSEAAARVQGRVRCRWLVLGGPEDAALAEKITADIRYDAERPPTFGKLVVERAAINLAGQTSLRELMALLKRCRVLLTNDTGPMHVAAALGTPVVVPFGSTAPELTGPGLPGDPRHALLKSGAPCSPCFRRECPIDFRCMRGISVEQVAEAVMAALNRRAVGP